VLKIVKKYFARSELRVEPRWGSSQRFPDFLAGEEGLLPLRKNPILPLVLLPFGLASQ